MVVEKKEITMPFDCPILIVLTEIQNKKKK